MIRFSPYLQAVAGIMISTAAYAGDFGSPTLGEAYANRNCAWCHGQSGQGFAVAPRLAGQRSEYLENQFADFKSHARDNPKSEQFMWGAARYISSHDAAAVAAYYAELTPTAANDGDRGLYDSGALTYRDGAIEKNIPSCVACHGPNGEGSGAIPRIAGLSYRYLKRRLVQWGENYHLAAKAPMPEIAKVLPPAEIEALASYLSFVR